MATITIPLEDKTAAMGTSTRTSVDWSISADLKPLSTACIYTGYTINCTVLATVTSGSPSPRAYGSFANYSSSNSSSFSSGTATELSFERTGLRVTAVYSPLVSLTFSASSGRYDTAITQASITLTYDARCRVTFDGAGITMRVDTVDSGTIPSYGSTPASFNGHAFIGWKSSLTGQTYTGALPAATDQDVTYTAVYDGLSVTIDYLYAEDGSNGYGSYYVDADDAFESGDDAGTVVSNIMEGGGGECVNTQEKTVVDRDADTVSAQAFIDDILQTYGLDISTGFVGVKATGCTAVWNAPYIELTDIQDDFVSLEVWFTDVEKVPEITDASLIYMGEQVGETNKVPTGQFYVISVGAVESKHQIEA